jgi:hypothetical protein
MANNRDLLKEAIADAKAVKETAIANAKAALEEAFAPRLTSMLSAKLEEMEKEDMDEGYDEVDEMKDSKEVEEGMEKEMDEAKDEMYEAEDMDEEMDLDEILAELEEGEDKEDMKEAEEMDEAKEDLDEAKEEMDEAEEIDEAEEDEEVEVDAESEDEDEEIDLEEMSEEDLKDFIEDVIADMVKAGELEAGEEFDAEEEDMEDMDDMEADDEIEVEDDVEMTMEGEEKEMDEVINEEEIEEGIKDIAKRIWTDPEMLGAIITVDGKKVSLKDFMSMAGDAANAGVKGAPGAVGSNVGGGGAGTMEEAESIMEEVNALRDELNEVNLLNAKLLYVNKIFRSRNLTESQKSKVLAAFDKAGSVNEVKLVFETITESVTAKKEVVKESLGRASKAAGVAPTRQPIVEVDSQVARWQKLAGIK